MERRGERARDIPTAVHHFNTYGSGISGFMFPHLGFKALESLFEYAFLGNDQSFSEGTPSPPSGQILS